jgi:zinc protease
MEAQTITSPGGIAAWLVEDYAVPTFALHFAFEGGSFQDPPGKDGLASFVTLMLSQGAGKLTGAAFQRRIEDLAIRLNFYMHADAIAGSVEALSETWDETADLLRPRGTVL